MARPKTPTLGIKLNHPRAVMPKQHSKEAACFDLVAVSREIKGNTAFYGTGLHFDIPDGYHLKVYQRSSTGFRDGMSLVNCVGIIDADYTGEVGVKLVRHSGDAEWPWVGDRIAQAMLVRNVKTELYEVQDIAETRRGSDGFGSTGK